MKQLNKIISETLLKIPLWLIESLIIILGLISIYYFFDLFSNTR